MLKVMTAAAAAALVVSTLAAQTLPPQTPPARTPPPATAPRPAPAPPGPERETQQVPAQQRPPGDPAVIERGKTLYGVTCSFCHGPDLRGGQLNGPNLLRSELVLQRSERRIDPADRPRRPRGQGHAAAPDERR